MPSTARRVPSNMEQRSLSVGQKRERADISLPRQAVAGHVVDENGDPGRSTSLGVSDSFHAGRQQLIERWRRRSGPTTGEAECTIFSPANISSARLRRFFRSPRRSWTSRLRADIFRDADAGRGASGHRRDLRRRDRAGLAMVRVPTARIPVMRSPRPASQSRAVDARAQSARRLNRLDAGQSGPCVRGGRVVRVSQRRPANTSFRRRWGGRR
jgi:hypothetical protein